MEPWLKFWSFLAILCCIPVQTSRKAFRMVQMNIACVNSGYYVVNVSRL